ncbi:MAG TPA: protein kinase [Vicinamibacterales bacterium]|jgi:serine/threonine protein kinase/Tol biopolymer transport system component|nr:protein kinase [Vicinamibacterales bacterium]
MPSERWKRVERVYHAARERPFDERAAFLDAACAGDAELQREVESLLNQPASGEGFLSEPAVAVAAQMVSQPGGSMLTGRKIGVYQIQTLLGAGGMGRVYRARDTSLGRDVAIKTLPPEFTSDPERLSRFQREARMLAALNHAHIGAIYGLEDVDGGRALVLELVEGETLAERIARGRLQLREASAIGRQIADALDAAHEKGIVHRDLKPANIKITPDGTVKVLDFGLAKLNASAASALDLPQSPTVTVDRTRHGMILGTAAYMSPEQARGQTVDKRTDIWAFGCVLYEMLTGRTAFHGATISDTLAAILANEPDWRALPADAPMPIRTLLRRCLEKDRKRRLESAADARLEIDDTLLASSADAALASPPSHWAHSLSWAAAAAVIALLLLGTMFLRLPRSPQAGEIRFEVQAGLPPALIGDPGMAVSPDGTRLAIVGISEGRAQISVRALNSVAARPLKGTEGASYIFWSPDGRSLGFFAGGQMKRVDIAGGSPQELAMLGDFVSTGAWNTENVIVFSRGSRTPLFRMPANGGDPIAVTRLEPPGQDAHQHPGFLPDGRHLLFQVIGTTDSGIFVTALDGSDVHRLVAGAQDPVFAPPNHLFFTRRGTLYVQSFDPTQRALAGEPVRIVDNVLGFSAAGPVLMYRVGTAETALLTWFDRAGKSLGTAGPPDVNALSVELSPEGKRAAIHRADESGNSDIWSLDLSRNVLTRLTSDPRSDSFPVWSPDGSHLIFTSNRRGKINLYEKLSSGSEPEHLMFDAPMLAASDWSRDGRFLLYRAPGQQNDGPDLWALPLTGDRKPFAWLKTPFDEFNGQFSPDSRWVAYGSNETGQFEVYIQSFPTLGAKWRVSKSGGVEPRWRGDGRELFYLAPDGGLMSVSVSLSADGSELELGQPSTLFHVRTLGRFTNNVRQQYAVTRDGQRFLVNSTARAENASPIIVVLNWQSGLGARETR